MSKKTLFVLVVGFLMAGMGVAMACGCGSCGGGGVCQDGVQGCAAHRPVTAVPAAPVDVGNTLCPVMGRKIEETTKAVYVHDGKSYNFCCAGCVDQFKQDLRKYSKIAEESVVAVK